jgi:hypothetical protein
MFDEFVRFLTGVDDGRQSGEQDDAAFALALLLIEVARSDDCKAISRDPVPSRSASREVAGRAGTSSGVPAQSAWRVAAPSRGSRAECSATPSPRSG